jgi:hypothetical protein
MPIDDLVIPATITAEFAVERNGAGGVAVRGTGAVPDEQAPNHDAPILTKFTFAAAPAAK